MAWGLTLGTLSFFLAVFWGVPLIRLLKLRGLGKQIRVEEPTLHQTKTGTPTMGGIMVILPVLIITATLNIANLMGNTLIGHSILVPMATMATFGIIGALDDLRGLRAKKDGNGNGSGMRGRYKLLWQVLLAVVFGFAQHCDSDDS